MNTITSLLDRLAQAERERDRARQQCLDSTRMVLEMKVAAEAKCDALRGLLREAPPQQAEPPDDGVRRAAADVISAWDAHGTAIALRGWIDILRQRLAETPAPAAPPADARITDDMVERACIAFSEAFWFYETRGGAKVRSMAIKAALRAALEGGR
jgi:hypothetical protein